MPPIARFETLTRIGFAARGLTYILIGWLALRAGQAAGASEALGTLAGDGFGTGLLALAAVGLAAYGAWRLLESTLDLEGAGDDAKGKAVRAGHGLSGFAHLFLALAVLQMALGNGGGSDDGDTARSATSWLLGLPAGGVLVRLVAVGLVAAGIFQFVEAVRLSFLKQLDPPAARKAWVQWVGRLGYAARGIVFGLVGLGFWRAGDSANAAAAGGMGDALAGVSGWMFTAVALGLLLFGVFSLVQARYRRIADPQVGDRIRSAL
ncbi:DUF1206 domain-containing protein [Sphingoaurantiacus capsulatus]|uniref:DUF1206 domain-containing protein n=1 Tax=Sphingoaurantiacus capsulatus TaxID=1771310 RepID=A0ABV7X841_9SPHN